MSTLPFNLQGLGLTQDDEQQIDYSTLQPERRGGPPTPYPGRYSFKLPNLNDPRIWKKITGSIKIDGQAERKVERVQVALRDFAGLVIVGTGPGLESWKDHPVWVNISNLERNRARQGQPVLLVSDMTYLIRALDPQAGPRKNTEFIAELCKHSGRIFSADLEYQAGCNEERDAWTEKQVQVADPSVPGGVRITVQTEQLKDAAGLAKKGCGKRFYLNDWPTDPATGRYYDRRYCVCGAILRPFPSLRNFGQA